MLRSMTGFARSVVETPSTTMVMEIQATNRRGLEISINFPSEYARFENEVRSWIKSKVSRGALVVRLNVTGESSCRAVEPNLQLVQKLYEGRKKVAEHLSIATDPSLLDWICEQTGVFEAVEEERDERVVLDALHELTLSSLSNFLSVKRTEGAIIEEEICKRLEILEQGIVKIEKISEGSVDLYREKLKNLLIEYIPGSSGGDEAILREACIYADKVDLTEEIVRFKAHLQQFRSFLEGEENSKGKCLDFTLQELNREINTIGAKSSMIEVSKRVVEMKNEIEKIKEQTFNVE